MLLAARVLLLAATIAMEELLVPQDQLKKMYVLRRILNPMGTMDAIEFLVDKLRSTKSNGEFFNSMSTGKN
jgi:transcription termination factor Rho